MSGADPRGTGAGVILDRLFKALRASENSLMSARNQVGQPMSHWFPWLMLVWTIWIFLTPLIQAKYFPHWFWPTMVSFPVFLVLFYRSYYRDRAQIVWMALGIAFLSFAVTPINP